MKIKSYASGTICLGITVNQQGPVFQNGKTCGQVNGGCGFAYTSFLICYTDYSCHFTDNALGELKEQGKIVPRNQELKIKFCPFCPCYPNLAKLSVNKRIVIVINGLILISYYA